MSTVQELRENGYTVKVRHTRRQLFVQQTETGEPVIDPHGGKTEVRVEKDGVSADGVANCSAKDNYSRKIGRNIALGRALKALRDKVEE